MGSDGVVIQYDASGHIISPFYGYLPSDPANKTFLILFVVTTLLHLAQATRARTWWLLPTVVLAGIGEILGWAARTWSFYKPLNSDAYLMQTVALVIAPTPLIGALFITFGRLSGRLGLQYSRISPRLYSRIFLTSDCVALLVQAAGGGIAASSDDRNVSRMGSNIMLGGIVFQLVSLSIFCVLMAEYLIRRLRNKPLRKSVANNSVDTLYDVSEESSIEKPMLYLAIGLCAETLFLYIRGVYRVIELADGWHGKVIQTQSLFIVFDGVMVLVTMLCLNLFHPGQLTNAKPRREASPTELKVSV
ncbi:RTA1 like protein [Trametes meyenii]|nr:RTA1 like protein [Trametes meyenii]